MDEMDLTSAESEATYAEIKEYVLKKFALNISSLYIAQIKEECGIKQRKNYKKSKNEDQRVPQCPDEKREDILEAFRYFKMI